MQRRDRIPSDPAVLVGKPIVKSACSFVELIVGWLAKGWAYGQVSKGYPHVTRDVFLAALAHADEMLRDEQYIATHKAVA